MIRRNLNCSGKNGIFVLDVASHEMVVGISKVITIQHLSPYSLVLHITLFQSSAFTLIFLTWRLWHENNENKDSYWFIIMFYSPRKYRAMKISVHASSDKSLRLRDSTDSAICKSFGRVKYAMLYSKNSKAFLIFSAIYFIYNILLF